VVTIIRPRRGWLDLGLGELWQYRELLWVLAARDVKVRYKQTLLGAAWAVIQPFTAMVIFSIFFGKLARMPSDGIPYPLFAFAALVPWSYFTQALSEASGSIVNNRYTITKIYFPRLILLFAPLFSSLVDLAVALGALLALMAYYGTAPTAAILVLPALVLLSMLTALAGAVWLAALNAHYRDFRYVIPFLMQAWLFATPIAYPASLVPPEWRTLYGLNPLAGVVEGFRWALLGSGQPPGPMLAVSSGAVLAVLASGYFFFRRMERTFVDVV
jgi:lipopolysaccharide transport system permease protein